MRGVIGIHVWVLIQIDWTIDREPALGECSHFTNLEDAKSRIEDTWTRRSDTCYVTSVDTDGRSYQLTRYDLDLSNYSPEFALYKQQGELIQPHA